MGSTIRRGTNFQVETTLVTEDCCNCGMTFAMPIEFKERKLKKRNIASEKTFYCPAGHAQHYLGETEETMLRRERDRLQQQVAQHDDEIDYQRRSARAYKGQATRLRRRAKAGVCPCCNRTFKQLAAHMANKHPGFTPEPPQLEVTLQ